MKTIKKSLLFLLVALLVLGICGCNKAESEIESLTKRFENACNKLDFDGMLGCVDPSVSDAVKAVVGFVGMFSDDDTDVLLDKFSKTVFNNIPDNSQDFFASIKIKLDYVEVDKESAFASGEITYEVSGEVQTKTANFEYISVDEEWYISNLDIE